MSDLRNPGTGGMGTGTGIGQPQGIPRAAPAPQPGGLRPPVQPGVGIRPPVGAPPPAIQPRPAGMQPAPRPPQPADDSIALVEDLDEVTPTAVVSPNAAALPASKIKFGPDLGHKKHDWKRKPHVTGTGACRVKSFHGKYSEQGVEHMDDTINEWLDEHPEVEVKLVTQTVHVFEGKIREPALVLNVWY